MNLQKNWYYVIGLIIAIGLLKIIKANILVIILFIQNILSMGDVQVNGFKVNKPKDYLLHNSYVFPNSSYLYGFISLDDKENISNGAIARYSYMSVELKKSKIDFYFLKKNGEKSNLLIAKNSLNNNFFELWQCEGKVFKAKILPEKYSSEHTTLFIEDKSVFILIKGEITELRKFKNCS